MEQTVSVIETFGSQALVRGTRASTCGGCAGESACSTLGSWVERFAEMRVDNPLQARVGDRVVVELPDGQLLRATFRLYGVPMLVFVVAGLLAHTLVTALQLPGADLWAALTGLAGVVATYLWLMRGSRKPAAPMGRIVSVEPRNVIPIKPV